MRRAISCSWECPGVNPVMLCLANVGASRNCNPGPAGDSPGGAGVRTAMQPLGESSTASHGAYNVMVLRHGRQVPDCTPIRTGGDKSPSLASLSWRTPKPCPNPGCGSGDGRKIPRLRLGACAGAPLPGHLRCSGAEIDHPMAMQPTFRFIPLVHGKPVRSARRTPRRPDRRPQFVRSHVGQIGRTKIESKPGHRTFSARHRGTAHSGPCRLPALSHEGPLLQRLHAHPVPDRCVGKQTKPRVR